MKKEEKEAIKSLTRQKEGESLASYVLRLNRLMIQEYGFTHYHIDIMWPRFKKYEEHPYHELCTRPCKYPMIWITEIAKILTDESTDI